MTRYVKTDYDGCYYITAGKVYSSDCVDDFGDPNIIGDDGYEITATLTIKSSHLNKKGFWRECDKHGNPI